MSTEATPAQGAVDVEVGRPVEEATNASGPRGTYGCACVSRNAFACAGLRYGYLDQQERCDCQCHNWEDDDDE